MIEYRLAAMALTGFSSCKAAKSVYRVLGNKLGGRRRAVGKMAEHYFGRVDRNVAFRLTYGPARPNELVLERGTGWVHWEVLIRYSASHWRRWYENNVQDINRLQCSDWMRTFAEAGLSFPEEGGSYADVSSLRIHPQSRNLSRKDIDCTTLLLVVRKDSCGIC